MSRRLLVIDDHVGLDTALRHLLASSGWDDVIQTQSATHALELVTRHRPHLVTVDLQVGPADGLDILRTLLAAQPHLAVVVLAGSADTDQVVEAMRAGARAFVPKSLEPAELIAALDAAYDGITWLPLPLIGPVVAALIHPPPASEWQELVASLSDREREVLGLLVTGLDRREIAARLTISLNTVRTHVKNILARLGVHSSLEAVSLALRAGVRPMVDLPELGAAVPTSGAARRS